MKIHIEYCVKWNYGPEFDRVSNELNLISKNKKKLNIIGNKKSPRSGAFEVTIDGNLVYSKFSTGNFPSKDDIRSWF